MSKLSYFYDHLGVDAPYISLAIAGTSLTPIPPRYVTGINIKATKSTTTSDDTLNTAVCEFTIHLICPSDTFYFGNDQLTYSLSVLLSSTLGTENKAKIELLCGWTNGAKIRFRNGYVTGFSADVNPIQNGMATYTLQGVSDGVIPEAYQKITGDISGFFYKNEYDIAHPESGTKTVTDYEYNEFDSAFETGGGEFGQTNPNGDFRLSNVIELLTKYIYGNYFKTIEVDHVDKIYNSETEFDDAMSETFSNLDLSSMTCGQLLVQLCKSCYEEPADGNTGLSYTVGEESKPVIYTNGKYYYENEVVNESAVKEFKNITAFTEYVKSLYPETFVNKTRGITGDRNLYFESIGIYKTANQDSVVAEGTDGKVTIKSSAFTVEQVKITDETFINSAKRTYAIWFDHLRSKIKIGILADSCIDTFIISNNEKDSDVISFSVSGSGIPASAALAKVDAGTSTTIDVSSAQSLVSGLDTGGLVALNGDKFGAYTETYANRIAQNISTNTSSATMEVLGSTRTLALGITDIIRIIPKINGGRTFWCGDYNIFEINYDIDDQGFNVKFGLSFNKSEYSSDFNEKLKNKSTQMS